MTQLSTQFNLLEAVEYLNDPALDIFALLNLIKQRKIKYAKGKDDDPNKAILLDKETLDSLKIPKKKSLEHALKEDKLQEAFKEELEVGKLKSYLTGVIKVDEKGLEDFLSGMLDIKQNLKFLRKTLQRKDVLTELFHGDEAPAIKIMGLNQNETIYGNDLTFNEYAGSLKSVFSKLKEMGNESLEAYKKDPFDIATQHKLRILAKQLEEQENILSLTEPHKKMISYLVDEVKAPVQRVEGLESRDLDMVAKRIDLLRCALMKEEDLVVNVLKSIMKKGGGNLLFDKNVDFDAYTNRFHVLYITLSKLGLNYHEALKESSSRLSSMGELNNYIKELESYSGGKKATLALQTGQTATSSSLDLKLKSDLETWCKSRKVDFGEVTEVLSNISKVFHETPFDRIRFNGRARDKKQLLHLLASEELIQIISKKKLGTYRLPAGSKESIHPVDRYVWYLRNDRTKVDYQ